MANIDIFSMHAKILSMLDENTNHEMRELREENPNSNSYFSDILSNFIHHKFEEDQAIIHWNGIFNNFDKLTLILNRKISIHTAIVDYFTNLNKILNSPLLIEQEIFSKTEKLTMTDSLTGAYNRRYMDAALEKELNRCKRYNKNLSLCIFDIDDFKVINDSYGHQTGDIILKNIALNANQAIREEDILCRYGGEEFLLILPETKQEGACVLANRIKQTTQSSPVLQKYQITFSAGLSTYPFDGTTINDLIKTADKALFSAKTNGKNRIEAASKPA